MCSPVSRVGSVGGVGADSAANGGVGRGATDPRGGGRQGTGDRDGHGGGQGTGTAAAVALFVVWWTSVGAAQQPVELKATAGFQDHVKVGAWAPVRVTISNTHGPAARGELVLPRQPANDIQEYRVPVDLPTSSRRTFTLYLRYRTAVSPVRIELRLRGRRPLTADVPSSPHGIGSRLVLTISRTAGGLSFIGAVPLPPPPASANSPQQAIHDSAVAYASPDPSTGALSLPDHPVGYSSLSAVVVRDVSPVSFQPEEQTALARWVRGGGLLVIVAGPNPAELRDSFLEELAPVRIRGQRAVAGLQGLARRFRAPIGAGEALVADAEPKPDADVVAEEGGAPILVRHRVESGMVYFLAADSSASPLRDADPLLLAMWTEMLEHSSTAVAWHPTEIGSSEDIGGLSPDTVRLPVVEWDAFAVFGGFLLAYIIILVPVNRFVLKRVDRREWTGWAVLISIALFSIGSLYLGKAAPLASCRAYETGIACAQSGASTAWLDGVVGIRSANERRFDLSAAGSGRSLECLVASRRAPRPAVDLEGGFRVPQTALDLWGFGAFRMEGPLDLGGRVSAQLATVDGRNLAVIVENRTPYPLKRAFVLTASAVHPVDEVAADSVKQLGPIAQTELAATGAAGASPLATTLAQHCDAADKRGASSEQRIRSRVLEQLTPTDQSAGSPYASYSSPRLRRGPGGVIGAGPAAGAGRMMFGAWLELPTPLAEVSPRPAIRTSEVLLLVNVPLDVTLPVTGSLDFGPLYPSVDWGAVGMGRDWDGRMQVKSGTHELDFALPPALGNRQATRLSVTVGCDQPGVTAEVMNFRTGQWELLKVDPKHAPTTELAPPNDYVRWPGGHMKVRLSRKKPQDTHVSCTASGALG